MSIDRTAYNALVNDDGSNTTGTLWNKAAIASVILDPVDAALAAAGGGFDVTAYGAIGNGTADDTSAIQAALTAAAAAGSSVFLPAGTYKITSQLTALCSIRGVGWTSIIKASASTFSMIGLQTTSDLILEDFALYGAETTGANAQNGIFSLTATAVTAPTIRRVLFSGPSAGVGLSRGIYFERVQNAMIAQNTFRRLRGIATCNAIFLTGALSTGSNIASASALPVPATGNSFMVTGTTTINTIDVSSGNASTYLTLVFKASLTVTHSANLVLLKGVSKVTEAEFQTDYPHDFVVLRKDAGGVWTQVDVNGLCSNYSTVVDNDIEFETGPADADKQGYCGIVLRNGGMGHSIRGNRIVGAISAQISIDSTRYFLAAYIACHVTGNHLLYLDAQTTSAQGYQEAAIELSGRSHDCVVDGNRIVRPKRFGIWVNEDGTYKSTYRNIVSHNVITEASRSGIIVLGGRQNSILNNRVYDCGWETTNTYDGIQIQNLPASGGEADDNLVQGNAVHGASTQRYAIAVLANSGLFPNRTRLINNVVDAGITGSYFDQGTDTKWFEPYGLSVGPFANQIKGYKAATNNTATAFLTVTIPNKTCLAGLTIAYALNSNTMLRMKSGFLTVQIGRFAGQNAAIQVTDTGQELALPGGSETFTAVVFDAGSVTGASSATQTVTVRVKLNSNGGLQSDLHWEARALGDGYVNNDSAAEITMAAA